MDPQTILSFVQNQGYFFLLLIMIVEGPIISYLASFVASQGFLNIYYIILLTWLGNVIGDLIFYSIGKFWKPEKIKNYFKKKHVKKNILLRIENGLKTKTGRTLMLVKLIPPHPAPGLIAAGLVDVPFPKFLLFSVITTMPQTFIFCGLGYFTGSSYNIFIKYFHKTEIAIFIIAIIMIITIVIFYLYLKKVKTYEKKI